MAAFGRGSTGASSRGSAISSDTQKLLDSMMKDAGINGKKAQSIKQALNSTGSLPGSLASSSTMSVGKQYSSSSLLSAHRPGVMNPRNSDRGRKTKAVIDQQIARDPDRNKLPMSRPGMDRDMEKEKLASLMQYEGEVPTVQRREARNTLTKHYCPRESNALAKDADGSQLTKLLQVRFAELAKEVDENQKFLQDMTKAGNAKQYTAEVNGLIAEKTREMREIDAKLSQL